MRNQDGDIFWDVTEVTEDGQLITELRFQKMSVGEYAGHYHPMFYWMPMIFLSTFIEPSYKLWRAYLGDDLIGANIVREDGRVVSYERGREIVDEFANSD